MSDPKTNLASALAKANSEIHNPAFDKENPHFRSKFASLAAVRNALVPIYAKHGLSIIQDLETVERGIACFTTLLHESGEERTSRALVITPSKNDAQGVAAAGTYAKRIQLQAVACVVGDDDDDGETAVGRDTGSKDIQRGVRTVDPRGEPHERDEFDPKERDAYASRFMDAMQMDVEEEVRAAAVHALHLEVAHKHGLYIAIADAISAQHGTKFKNAIRKYVDMHKKVRSAA